MSQSIKQVSSILTRSTRVTSLSPRRIRRSSLSWSNTFTTTGKMTACPSPPWWSGSFSSWWVTSTVMLYALTYSTGKTCLPLNGMRRFFLYCLTSDVDVLCFVLHLSVAHFQSLRHLRCNLHSLHYYQPFEVSHASLSCNCWRAGSDTWLGVS